MQCLWSAFIFEFHNARCTLAAGEKARRKVTCYRRSHPVQLHRNDYSPTDLAPNTELQCRLSNLIVSQYAGTQMPEFPPYVGNQVRYADRRQLRPLSWSVIRRRLLLRIRYGEICQMGEVGARTLQFRDSNCVTRSVPRRIQLRPRSIN